jgi:hypothetical protein
MKKLYAAVLVLALAIGAFAVNALRTETLNVEKVGNLNITYLHDTSSGTEFVCVTSSDRIEKREETHAMSLERANGIALAASVSTSVSCFPTGRVWGDNGVHPKK